MAAEVTGQWSGDPIRAGLAMVEQGLNLVLGATAWSLSDVELRAAVVELTGQVGRVQAARAVLLRENVSREVPDARGEQGARTVTLLRGRCRVSAGRACADVANAKVTCPQVGDLRGLGVAWAAGQVSTEHVEVARRVLGRVPRRIVAERREEVDALLTEHAKAWDPGGADRLAQHLLAVLVPERADRYDEHAHQRRHLGLCTDSAGMVLLRGQLDPAAGLGFAATLDHLVARDRATRGTGAGDGSAGGQGGAAGEGAAGGAGGPVPDLRTRGQRRADALTQMATLAAEHLGLAPTPESTARPDTEPEPGAEPDTEPEVQPEPGAEPSGSGGSSQPAGASRPAGSGGLGSCGCGGRGRASRLVRSVPRVVVVTTPDQLAGHPGAGPATSTDATLITHPTLTRLACDAVIDRVVLAPTGRILATDTLGRLATTTQQHALAGRDQGCTWPGCTAPPTLCEAHHVIWWSRGGPTTIDNLALLCHRHHTQIHAQPEHGWQLLMRDGLPWFRPPEHLDPARALRRNTFHHTAQDTRRTGTRWRTTAAADGPDPPPP